MKQSFIKSTQRSFNPILTLRQQSISTINSFTSRTHCYAQSTKTLPRLSKQRSFQSSSYTVSKTSPNVPFTRKFTTQSTFSTRPISTTTHINSRYTHKSAPYLQRSRLFSNQTPETPHPQQPPKIQLLPLPTPAQQAQMDPTLAHGVPLLSSNPFGTKQSRAKLVEGIWKLTKIFAVSYCVINILTAFCIAYFSPVVRNMVLSRAFLDLTIWGCQSQWYFPIFRQNAEYPLTFDPAYPALNFYRLKIFILKELEAAHRAGIQVSDLGETLRLNSYVRVKLLQNVVARGWALGSELSSILHGSSSIARLKQNNNALDGKWELEPRPTDPEYGANDQVELNRAQMEYLKQAIQEFQQLEKLGVSLYKLGLEIKTSTIASIWKMGFNNFDLRIDYDTETPSTHFHQLASVAASTGKLTDALNALASSNIEQILTFMHYFDKKIATLANYGPYDDSPRFPKLSFEVPDETQYAAQLGALQEKIRRIHDADFDPSNPRIITDEFGKRLNPSQHHQNRPYIPYVSPARPYPLIATFQIKQLEESLVLDPTLDQELEAAIQLRSLRFYDTWSELYGDLSDAIYKYRLEYQLQNEHNNDFQKQVKEVETSSSVLTKKDKISK